MNTSPVIRSIPHFAFLLLLAAGCSYDSSLEPPLSRPIFDAREGRSLRWLYAADPYRDLFAALARGDRLFVGIYCDTPFIPGVEPRLAAKHGVKYLNTVWDPTVRRSERLRLGRLASSYAERYNALLLQHLKR